MANRRYKGNEGSTALLLVLGMGLLVVIGGVSFVRISGSRSRTATRDVATSLLRRHTVAALEYFNQLVASGVIAAKSLPVTDPLYPGVVLTSPITQMTTSFNGNTL